MYNNSAKIMFMLIMMMGTILSVSSTSWLGAWMGLEINLLAFIPLMTASNNLMSSEAALKYFLTQALASSVLLMSIIVSSTKYTLNETMYMNVSMMMMPALLMKMGAAPLHWWFPSVMEGLSWINSLMLMTWQKIAPLMLSSLMLENNMNKMMLIPIIMSAIIGSMGGLNQTSLRKIMAYSSITHMSWMLAAMSSSEALWELYFLLYSLLTSNIVLLLNSMKTNQINQLFSSMFSSKPLKFSIMMNLLSLGGLPPFLGFMPKMMVIQALTNNNQIMTMTLLTITSLITLFFYVRMSHSAFMLNYNETAWTFKQEYSKTKMTIMLALSFITNSGLFLMSLIYMTI